jgi:cation diffusion facilitator family transporter
VVIAALLGNAAIAVTKFVAAAFTGSSAMFAEAVHSVVDTGNQALLLIGLARAERPADARHAFGHGKEIYFWAFVVAMVLFALGAGVAIYEGLHKLADPHPMRNAGWNYLVLGIAFLFEAGAFTVAWREFDKVRGKVPILRAVRQSKDPALFTVLFEDSAAMLWQAHPDVAASVAAHYLGRPATPPLALCLEPAWEVLCDPQRLAREVAELAPLERKLLNAVEHVGGEVDT